MRGLLVAMSLGALGFGCGGDSDDSASATSAEHTLGPTTSAPDAAVIDEVKAAIRNGAGTESFDTDPIGGEGRLLCIGGEVVRMYVFASAEDRAAAAALVDAADPSNVGRAIVEWVGQPRMWEIGPAVVMYSGDDQGLVEDLTSAFGAPFAQGRGRAAGLSELGC